MTTRLTCPRCGDHLPDVLPGGFAHLIDFRPYCGADCAWEAETRPTPCRYCPVVTRWPVCDARSCQRQADRAEDAAVERAVQADLARYQP